MSSPAEKIASAAAAKTNSVVSSGFGKIEAYIDRDTALGGASLIIRQDSDWLMIETAHAHALIAVLTKLIGGA